MSFLSVLSYMIMLLRLDLRLMQAIYKTKHSCTKILLYRWTIIIIVIHHQMHVVRHHPLSPCRKYSFVLLLASPFCLCKPKSNHTQKINVSKSIHRPTNIINESTNIISKLRKSNLFHDTARHYSMIHPFYSICRVFFSLPKMLLNFHQSETHKVC